MLLTLILAFGVQTQDSPAQVYPLIRLDQYIPAIEPADPPVEGAREFVDRGGSDDLPITSPQVEMTARADMFPTRISLAFNWVWLMQEDGIRRPVWFARLRSMNYTNTVERFADSRRCPAVEETLRQIDDLPQIEPKVPTMPTPSASDLAVEVGGGYLHDNTYGLRLSGLFDGSRYSDRLTISSGSDSPLAPLIADSLTRLKPCWTKTPPPRR